MSGLPSGTVSLLFSDIEGSTVLLSRLGPAYTEALDGQRLVLRRAWAEHGGTELGTEGDSFFVVFSTAAEAVDAATQAQRELAAFHWPAGEQVRVRMGIHTGSPVVHGDGYVGMDVHRAARIAGAAHGGQVLVSKTTAHLLGDSLPDRVSLKDLGDHQLKDITSPERLFQLAIDGLQVEFPPVKTLGAASLLPRPATPLVGRNGELAELTALLSSPQVRLVTLTGPGGSGKTRLAIGLAERLVDRFPDGVYFVSLAAATFAEVMWTTIAEVLGVPPEGRIPPGFFEHVAHRTALLVLDNLEQIDAADKVVADLLEHGPQVVVVATSRRPLGVPGEHVHAVPPLEMPEDGTVAEAEKAGAVQLFAQHARMAKASFRLTAANTADVVAVCRRLDGLPLAIELAASRSRLLSPAALLARLDNALDLSASSSLAAARQKTLRDTIAWSYNLLSPTQQAFFRRLGVFAGGADLEAISAVHGDLLVGADPLDLVADLVDASLVTITEDDRGEPRVGMLETIRIFAHEMLRESAEDIRIRPRHAGHYAGLVQDRAAQIEGSADQILEASRWFEVEHDNISECLHWALAPNQEEPTSERIRLGLQLCASLEGFWKIAGYFAEARRWLRQAVALSDESADTARCLAALSMAHAMQGEVPAARACIEQAVTLARTLTDKKPLATALTYQGTLAFRTGSPSLALPILEEAVSLARQIGEPVTAAEGLEVLALVKVSQRRFQDALDDIDAAIDVAVERDDHWSILEKRHNKACILRGMGRLAEAQSIMQQQIPAMIRVATPQMMMALAEDYACVAADLGRNQHAARLLGAADAMRERHLIPREASQQGDIDGSMDGARVALSQVDWDREYKLGRSVTVKDALTEAYTAAGDEHP